MYIHMKVLTGHGNVLRLIYADFFTINVMRFEPNTSRAAGENSLKTNFALLCDCFFTNTQAIIMYNLKLVQSRPFKSTVHCIEWITKQKRTFVNCFHSSFQLPMIKYSFIVISTAAPNFVSVGQYVFCCVGNTHKK